MSSDSSDDEDLNKLREAADTQFINDSMFHKKKVVDEPTTDKPQSLRRSKDDDEQFNLFRVSPAFRSFVAKHLSQILDEVLQKKLTDKTANYDSHIKPKRRKSGIKLFHNSPHFIKLKTTETVTPIMKKITTTRSDDEDANDDKYKSVAVSPEDILSKKDTKHWSTRSKAPIYTYHRTKNGLVLK